MKVYNKNNLLLKHMCKQPQPYWTPIKWGSKWYMMSFDYKVWEVSCK